MQQCFDHGICLYDPDQNEDELVVGIFQADRKEKEQRQKQKMKNRTLCKLVHKVLFHLIELF